MLSASNLVGTIVSISKFTNQKATDIIVEFIKNDSNFFKEWKLKVSSISSLKQMFQKALHAIKQMIKSTPKKPNTL